MCLGWRQKRGNAHEEPIFQSSLLTFPHPRFSTRVREMARNGAGPAARARAVPGRSALFRTGFSSVAASGLSPFSASGIARFSMALCENRKYLSRYCRFSRLFASFLCLVTSVCGVWLATAPLAFCFGGLSRVMYRHPSGVFSPRFHAFSSRPVAFSDVHFFDPAVKPAFPEAQRRSDTLGASSDPRSRPQINRKNGRLERTNVARSLEEVPCSAPDLFTQESTSEQLSSMRSPAFFPNRRQFYRNSVSPPCVSSFSHNNLLHPAFLSFPSLQCCPQSGQQRRPTKASRVARQTGGSRVLGESRGGARRSFLSRFGISGGTWEAKNASVHAVPPVAFVQATHTSVPNRSAFAGNFFPRGLRAGFSEREGRSFLRNSRHMVSGVSANASDHQHRLQDRENVRDRECIVVDWSDRIVPYDLAWRLQQVIVQLQLLRLNSSLYPLSSRPEDEASVSFHMHEHASQRSVERNENSYLKRWPEVRQPAQGRLPCDYVILLQHSPVYTLGQGGTPANILFESNVRTLQLSEGYVEEMRTINGCYRLLSRLFQEAEEAAAPGARFVSSSEAGRKNGEGTALPGGKIFVETPQQVELGEGSGRSAASEESAGREFQQKEPDEGRTDSAPGVMRQRALAWREEAPTVWRVERGGEVTYHAPGQLVVYPLLDLRYHACDLRWYVHSLEQVAINAIDRLFCSGQLVEKAANLGEGTKNQAGLVEVESSTQDVRPPLTTAEEAQNEKTTEGRQLGQRRPGTPGVWLHGEKVCAIGVKVKRWITHHGLALNVCTDLSGFRKIVPCGLKESTTGRLKDSWCFEQRWRKRGEETERGGKPNRTEGSCDASDVKWESDEVSSDNRGDMQLDAQDQTEPQEGNREPNDAELMKQVARIVKEEFSKVFSLKLVDSQGSGHTALFNNSVV
ncbi:lipoyl(octanoyl) transferase [Toxoplasma gondii MAS]|uniref:Lipoyl(Octanoyl) transferase n=1 Tax=Toxoplasma gondii MAS TaxID=943118 RepID=A0A086R0B5_TOXGO|nr:lipoyl(octanoyl) transferase [Toxoplasma gondii MAS]